MLGHNDVLLELYLRHVSEAYAFYVENKMDDPFYQPSCSSSWTGGNCASWLQWFSSRHLNSRS